MNTLYFFIIIIIILSAVIIYFLFKKSCEPPKVCDICNTCEVCKICDYNTLDAYTTTPITKLSSLSSKYNLIITTSGLSLQYIDVIARNTTEKIIIPAQNVTKFKANLSGQLELLDVSNNVLSVYPQIKPFDTFDKYIPYLIYITEDGQVKAVNKFTSEPIWSI